jgi:hypothetical protein
MTSQSWATPAQTQGSRTTALPRPVFVPLLLANTPPQSLYFLEGGTHAVGERESDQQHRRSQQSERLSSIIPLVVIAMQVNIHTCTRDRVTVRPSLSTFHNIIILERIQSHEHWTPLGAAAIAITADERSRHTYTHAHTHTTWVHSFIHAQ